MKTKVTLLAGSVALMASLGAQAQVIDLFSEPDNQKVVSADIGNVVADQYDDATTSPPDNTILGGFRDLVIEKTVGPDGLEAKLQVLGTINQLAWSNDVNVESIAAVQWDGDDSGDVATLQTDRGVDLFNLVDQEGCPTTGCDTFVFTILQSDLGFDFEIGIWSTSAQFTTIASTGQVIPDTAPLTLELPFSVFEQCLDFTDSSNTFAFTTTCGAGTDVPSPGSDGTVAVMTSVSAIQLLLKSGGTTAVDLSVASIEKAGVPEPASLALLGAGFLVGGFARRRKNSKA